ncbi:discoidin domain-containing protein [Actinopolymorpha alba]|uniref:discoidin domain-containing protein n=1 Tax=Actinopolymorpha alba TaxID=533267 RepID=UPI00035F69CB|nr:discoidin domain-containing protein [Actinopolymorpha alba]
MVNPLSRRTFLTATSATLVAGGASATGAGRTKAGQMGQASQALASGSENAFARDYYRLLLQHTRWTETVWDGAAGHYQARDFNFTVVLGHAVLLNFGTYDAEVAGISRDLLEQRTLATIRHFAASNKWAGGSEWGARIYWDSTFEAYFIAATRLLWDRLDSATRANVETIARGSAGHIVGPGRDENTTLAGGFRGDSKVEEMGAKSMPLAAAYALLPDDPAAGTWWEWLDLWSLNMGGLPPADQANPALIAGRPVSAWLRSQNIFDTFAIENHGTYAPMYQASMGAYPGRNAVQFLVAGQPVPESQLRLPNADELWATLAHLGTDAGLSAHPMIADRYHLYGRDVLPLTYRTTVVGDRYAAGAERLLADRLGPYVAYPPVNLLTKFSGEPKYEPEARAELAMAYLLHYWRDRLAGDVDPVSAEELFARISGATDYGAEVGLVGHQTAAGLAMAVSKPGYVKFAFVPEHDDWLLDPAGGSPAFIPSVSTSVTGRTARVYRLARDGFDGSATLLATSTGFAGFTTLPDGSVVYATSGLAEGDGVLRLFNLTMPGVRGLAGDRTFHGPDGSATLAGGNGDGGVDEVRFAPVEARHVRFLGAERATAYGYSIYAFEVYAGTGPDLALGRPATASSYDDGTVTAGGPYPPGFATDDDPLTRWAVDRTQRTRDDSWLDVDLGSSVPIDRIRVRFEAAYARGYRLQVSSDGVSWRDVARIPDTRSFAGPWLNLDDRVGFVIRGSRNPVEVTPTSVVLSAGPASGARGMVVEGYPATTAEATARLASEPAPSGGPDSLRASLAGGCLSLFNLSAEPITEAALRIPRPAGEDGVVLFRGTQRTDAAGTAYLVSLAAAEARVEPPRCTLVPSESGASVPALSVEVLDSRDVRVTNTGSVTARVRLTSAATGRSTPVVVPPGQTTKAHLDGPLTPVADLALTCRTYPTSPLPAGMSDPDAAVDGRTDTAWRPGPSGRMVVDLGASRALGAAVLRWTSGRVSAVRVETSGDGLDWTVAGQPDEGERAQRVKLGGTTARYVAVGVPRWRPGDADLTELRVEPPPA